MPIYKISMLKGTHERWLHPDSASAMSKMSTQMYTEDVSSTKYVNLYYHRPSPYHCQDFLAVQSMCSACVLIAASHFCVSVFEPPKARIPQCPNCVFKNYNCRSFLWNLFISSLHLLQKVKNCNSNCKDFSR